MSGPPPADRSPSGQLAAFTRDQAAHTATCWACRYLGPAACPVGLALTLAIAAAAAAVGPEAS